MKKSMSFMLIGIAAIGGSLSNGTPVLAQGIFSQSGPLGNGNLDASVGLSSSKTYLNAVNINGGAITINGVNFSGATGLNPSGSTWSTTGLGAVTSGGDAIGGNLGILLNTFNHNPSAPVGAIETFRLTGLTVGQTYVMTFYSKSYDALPTPRLQDITSSSGASLTPYDQSIGGKPNANLLRYTFTASNATELVSISQRAYNYSMHQYGFTTEHVFTNAWTSGADWTTAIWGTPGVPNAPGANANLLAQGAPTTLNLDAPVTVGHIQMDGANAWTVSGASTLKLQADIGGVSVLSTPSGTHTLAAALALSNDVLKTGSGTLILSGGTAGEKTLNIGAGTVKLSNGATGVATTNTFTSDATSGIGTANLRYGTNGYNLALAFDQGANVTINGITFTNTGKAASGSSGPINWSLSNWNYNGASGSFPTGFQPVSGQQTYALLNHFYYYGAAQSNTTQTLTITGLTPGQAYNARIYYRSWSNPSGARVSNWTFDPGTGTITKLNSLSEDSNATGNYIEVSYVTGPEGRMIFSAVNMSNASWHLYGFSNQQIPNILPAAIQVQVGKGAILDLNGGTQMIASLSDFNGSGGMVTNSAATTPASLIINQVTTNTYSGAIADSGTHNALNVFKTGAGPLTLSGANSSYSGITILAGGTVNVASLGNYGSNCSLGNRPPNIDEGENMGLLFRGGTLQYTGTTPQSTDRAIRISTTGGGGMIDASGSVPSATVIFSRTAASPNFWEWPGARTLTLTGSNTGDNTFAMPISDTAGTTVHLTKSGAGKWLLASTNSTYNGVTTLSGGILNVANLSNYGIPGGLGKRASGSDGGEIGILFRGGTLQYTGSTPQSTDRAIRISTTGGGGTIDASGTDPSATLNFSKATSPNFWENPGGRTLTLTGSNTGSNTFAMVIADVSNTTTALKKDGAGTWVITGVSTFKGGTTVQSGILEVGGSGRLGTENVTVNGGTLRLAGTGDAIADTKRLTLATGATVQLDADETVNEFYLNGVQQYRGTWGSYSSPAFIKDPRFSGTGVLRVLSGQPFPGTMIKFQ